MADDNFNLDQLLSRIDDVLGNNKRVETVLIVCALVLFLCGIACIASALFTGQYLWSTPAIVTTVLLKWPIEKIQNIRRDNIALATAPAIIKMLPRATAAAELQKLIQKLYGETKNGQ